MKAIYTEPDKPGRLCQVHKKVKARAVKENNYKKRSRNYCACQ